MNVAEGSYVGPGAVIARLSGRQVQADYLDTEAELHKAEAQLDQLMTGHLDEEIQVARDTVKIREHQVGQAQKEVTRVQRMVRENAASPEELDKRIKTLEVAQQQLITAGENLSRVQQGFREELVREAEADVKRYEEKLRYYGGLLKLLDIKSPIAGHIALPYMKERQGQHVSVGELIAVVQDTNHLLVEIAADDAAALDVRVGMPVHIRLHGNQGELIDGEVRRIAASGETSDHFGNPQYRTDSETYRERSLNAHGSEGNFDVRVYVEMKDPPKNVMTETYGYARIVVNENDVFWRAMARPLVRFLRTQAWSWLP
jgi:HlyD family secretion protein